MSPVALVLVSHSDALARGVRDVAAAMAPDVHIGVAGGLDDGTLGTSFDLVEKAAESAREASAGAGVAILTDLGSATLTVDTVLEFMDDPNAMRFAPGPLVEGAIAAAVAAQGGGDVDAVVASALGAARQWCEDADSGVAARAEHPNAREPDATADAVVVDPAGLHARPCAAIARLAQTFASSVAINGVPATSIMETMALGVRCGDRVTISATGPDAVRAVETIASAIGAGLDSLE